MTATKASRVVVKIEQGETDAFLLFFPDEKANPGNIAYYSFADGCHGEATKDYYRACTHADASNATNDLVIRYVQYVKTLPGYADYAVERVWHFN